MKFLSLVLVMNWALVGGDKNVDPIKKTIYIQGSDVAEIKKQHNRTYTPSWTNRAVTFRMCEVKLKPGVIGYDEGNDTVEVFGPCAAVINAVNEAL